MTGTDTTEPCLLIAFDSFQVSVLLLDIPILKQAKAEFAKLQ